MGFTGTAGEGDLRGIRAVSNAEIGNGFARVFHRDGVRDGDLVVVPHALFADEREVKLGIERGNGNIEAVDLVGKAIGIGDGVGRGL